MRSWIRRLRTWLTRSKPALRIRLPGGPVDLEALPPDPLELQWEADRAYILDVADYLERELGRAEKAAFLSYCLELARQECGREIFFLAVRNYLRKINRRERGEGSGGPSGPA